MAFDLGSLATNIAAPIVNGVTTAFNTLTTNTFSNSSNFSNGTNAVARNLSQGSSTTPLNSSLNIGGLSNQLLGDFNPISKFANQATGAIGAISRITGSPNTSIQGLIAGRLSSSGLGSFASSISSLSSIGSAVARRGSIGAFNQVTVVNRSNQELSGIAEIQQVRQFMQSQKPIARSGPANYNGGPSYTVNNKGRIENPLRPANSFNYIITLGILDAQQLNNPSSYRGGKFQGSGFKKVLIKSGGGERGLGYSNRIRTFAEGDQDAEYFIDDLEINAVIAPNPNTSVALGTNVTFKVTEPYSMGKLIESMMVGAQECGYSSYVEAPFCLKIEFVGWNERGEKDTQFVIPSFIPIRINKMDFSVGQQGSVYQCTAVPYNESALADVSNRTKVAISPNGNTVHSILEKGRDAVTYAVNGQIETLEEKKVIAGYDRYIIVFPKTEEALQEAIKNKNFDITKLREESDNLDKIRLGVRQTPQGRNPGGTNGSAITISPSAPDQYLFLKSWADDINNVNEFGLSVINADSRDGGDRPPAPPANVIDPQTGTANRNAASSSVPEQSRKFNFTEGAKITDIITEVLMSSAYVKELPSQPPQNGYKKWFRIETLVFIEPSSGGEIEGQLGRPRKVFVYAVHPYWTRQERHNQNCQGTTGQADLKKHVKKEYNYYYTGKNEDILNFDINFNNAFFQNIRADAGQNSSVTTGQSTASTGAAPGTQVQGETQRADCRQNQEPQSSTNFDSTNRSVSSGGTRISTTEDRIKRNIAEQFHSRLVNSPVDMVTADMDIWGDPYYIPSQLGNYAPPPGEPSVNGDGTMPYMRDEVYILVRFLTPLDYLINRSTMGFASEVPMFSGLYQVWNAQSTFSSGQFKQKIKLIRMPNQNPSDTASTTNGILTLGQLDQAIGSDPSRNANPNPQNSPARTPEVSASQVLTRIQNNNTATGSAASFSQARLMTGEVPSGTERIVTNAVSSIASALPAEALASLPIDTASRLGINANLTTTIFPLKLPSNYSSNLPASLSAIQASNAAQALSRSGLNGPLGSLPFNVPSAAGLPPLPGIASTVLPSVGDAANAFGRIQSSLNSNLSGLSTQARAVGIRPPTG